MNDKKRKEKTSNEQKIMNKNLIHQLNNWLLSMTETIFKYKNRNNQNSSESDFFFFGVICKCFANNVIELKSVSDSKRACSFKFHN